MSDKRSVHTDALATLGTIIDEGEKRDAIHLAVEPAIAAVKLFPGQDVGLVEGGAGPCAKPLGIVDPFLKAPVNQGERFWLIVYPRQITSLRHVWEHPAFPNSPMTNSEEWLRNYAARIGAKYNELISHASEYAATGEYWCDGGRWEGEYLGDEAKDFWHHFEQVTKRTDWEYLNSEPDNRGNFFTCSC